MDHVVDAGVLPAGFDDLERFVADYALPTERQRCQKRLSVTLPELHIFYDAILPRMNDVMDHLQQFPDDLAAAPLPARNLYHLAQSYFEASNPIELKWKDVDLDDAFPESRVQYVDVSDREN